VAGQRESSSGVPRRSSSLRHYVISSSSSSSSRSRSSSRSSGRSRSPKYRHRHRRKHSGKRYHSGSKHRSHSRSRSHSHGPSASSEKKTGPHFGTNSTDPRMIAARLFVGSLPFDITKDDIRGIFGKYGKIIGKCMIYLLLVFLVSSNFCYNIDNRDRA